MARQTGTKGETERGQTARQAGTEHTAGAEDKRRQGRGTRMATRLGSGGGERRRGTEQGENEKEIYKYLRERREEKRR